MPNSTSIRPVYRAARCVFISNYPFDSNCYQCGESREAHDDPSHLMPTQPNHNAGAATSALKAGDRVRSIINPLVEWRISAIGPKRATLVTTEGGYMKCVAAPSILRKSVSKSPVTTALISELSKLKSSTLSYPCEQQFAQLCESLEVALRALADECARTDSVFALRNSHALTVANFLLKGAR